MTAALQGFDKKRKQKHSKKHSSKKVTPNAMASVGLMMVETGKVQKHKKKHKKSKTKNSVSNE